MSDLLEMQPYLMLASRVQAQLEQRCAVQPFADLVVRGRIETGSIRADQLSAAALIARRNARFDGAARWIGHARHQRQVMALELMSLEQLSSCGVRIL